MVSLKITENDIIKVLLAILGSWKWGSYGGPNLQGYNSFNGKGVVNSKGIRLSKLITGPFLPI